MSARPHTAADHAAECRAGRHTPGAAIHTDDKGVQHAVCHRCGCPLARLPVLRKWYRTGQQG